MTEKILIQIGDEVREATAEEIEAIRQAREEKNNDNIKPQ